MRLDECCDIISGATPSTSVPGYWDGDIHWATPRDLADLEGPHITGTPRRITQAGLDACAATVLPEGSVLFSSRAPIGHVAINTVPMATNQGFKSFIPKPDRMKSGYLYHWLRCNRAYLESLGNGATFKEVSKAVVARIEVPVPPLDEQRRIAAILDEADALRAKRRAALAQLDEMAQAIFVEMFGPPPYGTLLRLRDCVEDFRYGTSNKSGEGGYPTLRIPNVIGGGVDISDLKTVEVTDAEFSRLRLRGGDVLFVRTNGNPEYVGRCARVPDNLGDSLGLDASRFIYASYLIRARLTSAIDPDFLCAFLSMGVGRKEVREHAKTSAGQFNINVDGLGALRIPAADIAQQKEFAARLRSLDGARDMHLKQASALESLFVSLQHRAFRGEL